jgi:hypothetical protein
MLVSVDQSEKTMPVRLQQRSKGSILLLWAGLFIIVLPLRFAAGFLAYLGRVRSKAASQRRCDLED